MSTFLFVAGYLVIAVLLFFPIKRMIYTCFKAKYPLLYSTVEKRAEMWAEDSGLAYLHAAVWPVGLPITLFMFGPRLNHRFAPEDRKPRRRCCSPSASSSSPPSPSPTRSSSTTSVATPTATEEGTEGLGRRVRRLPQRLGHPSTLPARRPTPTAMLNRLPRFFRPEPWDDPPPCRCGHPRHEHQMETTDGACAWLPCGCRRYRP